VDYDQLNARIEAAGIVTGAAEAHGMFCGLLCGGAREPETLWLGYLLEEMDPQDLLVQECEQDLLAVGAETREAIEGLELVFPTLLPDDARPLAERVQALKAWCQGFLYGLGLTGTSDPNLSDEAAEALRDLAEIARADVELSRDAEEDESAYTELHEFLWVAATLIHDGRMGRNEGNI
jgi:yecA family protein